MNGLISNSDFMKFYSSNSAFIDFVIFFAIFTSIARLSLAKSFSKDQRSLNLLSLAIGLTLAFSGMLLEAKYQHQLFDFKIYIFTFFILMQNFIS